MAERGCGLAVIAEPLKGPKHPCWLYSKNGRVALHWRRTAEKSTPCSNAKTGNGWASIKWGGITIVGVYLSPNLARVEVEDRLEELETFVRGLLPGPVLVAGDFNAKSTLWGSRRRDVKGGEVEDWAARLDLHLLNTGTTSTCVRPQGESIVDLTWASPAAAGMVKNWRVAEEYELLSDHLPIEYEFARPDQRGEERPGRPLRWSIKKMDPDKLLASLMAETWAPSPQEASIEEQARWLREVMTRACDFAMPRAAFRANRRVYWWSEEISDLRKAAVKAIRSVLRARSRAGTSRRELEALLEINRTKRRELRAAIRKAKEKA
ncbi:PREDICTED: uncharacterized protein LOC105556181 [Vollenhovia emeryi]|uniref:uncharacterized protein LOC105556181 n=1 Tax=Vollenhovia emeryi TaxID=411798 RepID=UPI0005F48A78|nr:PREDICTED: uncharacterized protein LOC105556181 [Vollenhovia emeryi]